MKSLWIITSILLSISVQAVASSPVIRLNTTGQPPLNTADQQGFMDEVATEAFRRINITLKTVRLPAERGLKNSNRGIIDGELVRVAGMEKLYPNLIRVPEKIMDWEFVAFSYKPINLTQGWASLSGKSVAHINGWKILEKNIPTTAEIIKVSNADDLFNLLHRKHTDYVLYERWGGRYLLQEMSINKVQLQHPSLAVKEMFIYLHSKHAALVPKLKNALTEMKNDGSYQQLVQKHLSPFE